MSLPIKVFIVAETSNERFELVKLLRNQAGLWVCGSASFESGLLGEVVRCSADTVVMNLPSTLEKGRNALQFVRQLRLPTVVCTHLNEHSADEVAALFSVGMIEFVVKPGVAATHSMARDLLEAIKEAVAEGHQRFISIASSPLSKRVPKRVIAIGSSTGGPEALASIIPLLPQHLKAGVVIVQHMPGDFTGRFAERLAGHCKLPVKEAEDGDTVEEGTVLIARGDYHLVFHPITQKGIVRAQASLTLDPPQWKLRPTVNAMMSSLAPIFGNSLIGVILTGMGQDGLVGMRDIRRYGGRTIAQDEESSVVYGMAQEVVKHHLADHVLPLTNIVPHLISMTEGI